MYGPARHLKAIIVVPALVFLCASASFSATGKDAETGSDPGKKPEYDRAIALKSIINPHEQITDEGDVIWRTCKICHRTIPDIKRVKSIKDADLRYEDNIEYICRRCHDVPDHPAKEGISVMVTGGNQPKSHFVVPPKYITTGIRISLKDKYAIMPMDPKTGKIFCATCHNPHERGLLTGRADAGADGILRLRSGNTDICQYCHRR